MAYVLADMDKRPGAGTPAQDWDAFDAELNRRFLATMAVEEPPLPATPAEQIQGRDGLAAVVDALGTVKAGRKSLTNSAEPVAESANFSTAFPIDTRTYRYLYRAIGPTGSVLGDNDAVLESAVAVTSHLVLGNVDLVSTENHFSALETFRPGQFHMQARALFAIFEGFERSYVTIEGAIALESFADGISRRREQFESLIHVVPPFELAIIVLVSDASPGEDAFPPSDMASFISDAPYGTAMVVEVSPPEGLPNVLRALESPPRPLAWSGPFVVLESALLGVAEVQNVHEFRGSGFSGRSWVDPRVTYTNRRHR
ncbi:hypothetical protein [Streptomyces sp. NBC_00328]|uniref:hypothetical protein n=1 Tax=Streptomyces sp. NBC_00328 TaxID=2903646 RepID=UPI002E2958BD|nr:hypothetical protein [Streptomyces sp. NBC_00328]